MLLRTTFIKPRCLFTSIPFVTRTLITTPSHVLLPPSLPSSSLSLIPLQKKWTLAPHSSFSTPRTSLFLSSFGYQPKAFLQTTNTSTNNESSTSIASPKKPTPPPSKPPLWQRIKDECQHYLQGGKLLMLEVKLSSRYLRRVLLGEKLSRRELRQMKRTLVDVFRLVPFLILIAIPFAELALPFLLRFFPNMLPSTFEKQFEKEEKKIKLLKMRMEIAKFLQETVGEMAMTQDTKRALAAQEFSDFFKKIRVTGEHVSTDELLNVAKKFENEVTLENLSRPQLVSMCKYMGVHAIGTDAFLRFQLRNRMRELHNDDQMIFFEGVPSLSISELQKACADRGIKTVGVDPERLRQELQQWLDLHLIHRVPSSLLILSRAFILSDTMADEKPAAEALQATLESLPENLIKEAERQIQPATPNYLEKIESLRHQEAIIAKEREEALPVSNEHPPPHHVVEISEALKVLSSKSPVTEERSEFKMLKQAQWETPKSDLQHRVDKLISRIAMDLENCESEVGTTLNLVHMDSEGRISKDDLKTVLNVTKLRTDSEVVQQVFHVLDKDRDGRVALEELLSVAEQLKDQEGQGVIMDEVKTKNMTQN
ncbi:hypothetical protein HMI54_015310 [Coelomomyces lativittatus]|nr:hypothetical protein HMI56_000553 [Coelomomyces lativittatus]KAJ1517031.1 hypothetical protein HMI55_000812 [Coelomomyces lativittatus]KAJ1518535.1 hypothetical protein HMI54_015310 [Coelomomyces lativittatus]